MRVVFAGFRHGHIFDLYTGVSESADMKIVACAEEDATTRGSLARDGKVSITHESITDMLDHVDYDIVAVGDYYGRRGSIIIESLKRGKHVIADKPTCTRLTELDEIERLTAKGRLTLGCQLDLRDNGKFIRMRELALAGAIGEIHAISIGGQHPLLPETRPHWYFEAGKHGGTINDIGIHAFDLIPWMTGLSFETLLAARSWNSIAKAYPHFKDAGQFMLSMSNGCGVLGDVSYLMPGTMGYSMDQYWRTTLWGSEGMMEASLLSPDILLATTSDQGRQRLPPAPNATRGYLKAFCLELQGCSEKNMLTTGDVIAASRMALTVQATEMPGKPCLQS